MNGVLDSNQIHFVFSLKKYVSNSILPLSLNNEMVWIFKYDVFLWQLGRGHAGDLVSAMLELFDLSKMLIS